MTTIQKAGCFLVIAGIIGGLICIFTDVQVFCTSIIVCVCAIYAGAFLVWIEEATKTKVDKLTESHKDESTSITQESEPQTEMTTHFSKAEFERVIKTIAKMSYLFRDSATLKSTGGGRNQKMMSTLHSYAGMIGYLYQYTYKFGTYSDLVDQQMTNHFTLVAAAMSDSNHRQQSIKQLADNWSDVLQPVLYMQIDGTSEGNQMKALQAEIDFVTKMFETLSGSKCRKPKNEFAEAQRLSQSIQNGRDKYSKMVDEANFNPFRITTNPSLQVNPPLPQDMTSIFRGELMRTYSPVIRQRMDDMQIFSSYVFNMVESYYNNAGYVPKNTVDAIIEQCYDALKQTQYASCIGSLEQVKDYVYYNFLNK